MSILLLLGTVLAPALMFALRRRKLAFLFDLLAAASLLLANMAAGLAVLDIKRTHTEFTTHVHEVFNNPLFLAATGYVGIYAVYRLLATTAHTWQTNSPAK